MGGETSLRDATYHWQLGGDRVLKQSFRCCAVIAIALCVGCAADQISGQQPNGPKPSANAVRTPSLDAVAEQIIAQTNAFRAQEGLPAVSRDPVLQQAADGFALFMAQSGKYGHEADGREPAQRVSAAGYEYCIAAENIAYQFDSRGFTTEDLAQGLTSGWENSPPHRKNMLDPDVYDTAVAVAQSPATGYYYGVQLFGRPRSKAIEFKVANRSGGEVHYLVGDQEFILPTRYLRTHVRCRPADLRLMPNPFSSEAATDAAATTDPAGESLQPESGATYVVRRNASGGIFLSRRS